MSEFRYEAPYLLINGKKLGSSGRIARPVRNPANGNVIAELPCATRADLDVALESAASGFLRWEGCLTARARENPEEGGFPAARAQ